MKINGLYKNSMSYTITPRNVFVYAVAYLFLTNAVWFALAAYVYKTM